MIREGMIEIMVKMGMIMVSLKKKRLQSWWHHENTKVRETSCWQLKEKQPPLTVVVSNVKSQFDDSTVEPHLLLKRFLHCVVTSCYFLPCIKYTSLFAPPQEVACQANVNIGCCKYLHKWEDSASIFSFLGFWKSFICPNGHRIFPPTEKIYYLSFYVKA